VIDDARYSIFHDLLALVVSEFPVLMRHALRVHTAARPSASLRRVIVLRVPIRLSAVRERGSREAGRRSRGASSHLTHRWRRTDSNLRSRLTRPTFPKTGLRRLPAASAPPIMRRGRNWSWAGANTSFTCSYKRVPHIYRTFCVRLVRGVTTSPGQGDSYQGWAGGLGAGRVFRDEPPDSWRVIASRTERQPRPRSRRDGRRALRD
jgi:hypothetical protein